MKPAPTVFAMITAIFDGGKAAEVGDADSSEELKMNFTYDKGAATTQSELLVSVADLRDLVQAFTIPDEAQRLHELPTSFNKRNRDVLCAKVFQKGNCHH